MLRKTDKCLDVRCKVDMSKNDDINYEKARRELEEAQNEIRKLRGKPTVPYKSEKDGEPPYCSFCGKGE